MADTRTYIDLSTDYIADKDDRYSTNGELFMGKCILKYNLIRVGDDKKTSLQTENLLIIKKEGRWIF